MALRVVRGASIAAPFVWPLPRPYYRNSYISDAHWGRGVSMVARGSQWLIGVAAVLLLLSLPGGVARPVPAKLREPDWRIVRASRSFIKS